LLARWPATGLTNRSLRWPKRDGATSKTLRRFARRDGVPSRAGDTYFRGMAIAIVSTALSIHAYRPRRIQQVLDIGSLT